MDGQLNWVSDPGQVIRLSEGRCVLQSILGCRAAAVACNRVGATGSERPSGASTRQGVRSIRKGTCMDRVCAPDAFSFSLVSTGCHSAPCKTGTGFLWMHKNPEVSDMQCRVYAPVPRSVPWLAAIFNHILYVEVARSQHPESRQIFC